MTEVLNIDENTLIELRDIAVEAALEAGMLIAGYRGKQIEVKWKEGGDNLASQVLTEVDLKCQNLILQKLSASIEKYDLGLLAEEDCDDGSRLTKHAFWCIDPIDGTLPFTEDKSGYAVSIGLVSLEGEALVGVAYDPRDEVLYSAVKGLGAFRNGKPWKLAPHKEKAADSLTWIMDRDQKDHPRQKELIQLILDKSRERGLSGPAFHTEGGAVLNACWTLENHPAVYFKLPKTIQGGGCIWDFAASVCIVKEAGGWVSDYEGKELNLNNKETLYMNREGVLFASSEELAKDFLGL
jgi:fructose-1,6-bisphosphatase/inositol monophosphatase family enzyme